MHIKSYKTNRFAGLKNLDIEFEDGLNVILGPNESGKSTLIEGIYHTLFKEAKLTKNRKADKEFTNRFMPISKGDTIDGKLTIKYSDKEYEIYKSWGADTKAELIYDDGYIIRDENSIKKELEKIFDFGESTYSNIVFAKQKNLKKAINNIMENPDLSKEMTDVLRRTMMELDGVSIDLIEKNLIEEKEKLFNRWDIEKSYPQNNKGINDPYKVGLGTIIKSFYNKEGLKIQVKEAYEAEKNFEIIAEELNNVKKQKKIFEAEKENLDSIKDDINNREVFNYKLELLNKDEVELKEINENWPKYEMKLSNIDEKIKFLEKNTEELEDKKKLSEKCDEKIKLKSKIETIEKIEEEIILLKEKLDKISIITDVDIDNLRKLENEMMKLETTMSAGKIIGIIKKDSGKEIYIKNDFEDRRLLDTDNFSAKGFVNIVYNDEFELEIKTGELDFNELSNKYKSIKEEFFEKLENLKIKNINEGSSNLLEIKDINNKLDKLNDKKNLILDNKDIEDIKERYEELDKLDLNIDIDLIEESLKENSKNIIDLKANKANIESKIDNWEKLYGKQENIIDKLVDKKMDKREIEKNMADLKPLPENFENFREFKDRLNYLDENIRVLRAKDYDLNEKYYLAERDLSDETYEELNSQYLEAKKEFNRQLERGKNILKIEKVFYKVKESMDNNPMQPLIKEFGRLLEIITAGDYNTGNIREDFYIELIKEDTSMPIDLLSAGTYDSVALALRFAMLKYIFDENKGYVILDDCLVDLDPERKKESINLIKEFAKDYQIIFTTCDPDTAKALGGNIINM